MTFLARVWRMLMGRKDARRSSIPDQEPDPELRLIQKRQDELDRRLKAIDVRLDVRRRGE